MTVLKMLPAVDAPSSGLKDALGAALDLRDHYIHEVQEAEALLAQVAARVQKRKVSLAKYETQVLELRTQAHLLGVDRAFGKILMEGVDP